MKILNFAVTVLAFAGTAYSYCAKEDLQSLYGIIISYDSILVPHLRSDRTIDDINDAAVESVLLGLIQQLYSGLNTTITLVDLTEAQNPGSISDLCNWNGIKSAFAEFSQLLFNYAKNPPQSMPDKQSRIDHAIEYLRTITNYSQFCKIFYKI